MERGRANAERVAVEPAGGELSERLRRRLVQRAERRAPLLLEHEAVGVLLQVERARALAAANVDPARAVALTPVAQPVGLDMRHRYSNSLGCESSDRLVDFGRLGFFFALLTRRFDRFGSASRWSAIQPRNSSRSKRRVPPIL